MEQSGLPLFERSNDNHEVQVNECGPEEDDADPEVKALHQKEDMMRMINDCFNRYDTVLDDSEGPTENVSDINDAGEKDIEEEDFTQL